MPKINFSNFANTLSYKSLPEELLVLLRRSFMDTMGVAALGSTTEMSERARRASLTLFGAAAGSSSRMLMDGRNVSPAGAAMAGAFTVDSIDAHDGNTPNKGHAGSAVFPAVLAVADSILQSDRRISGQDLAVWLAVAYEVSYRAGQVQHATCTDYHTSGAWTAVGVAVAVTRMLEGSDEQIRHAAGIAEYHGPRSQMMRCIDFPTNLRDGVGWGAPSGVTAAYLALEGFTGAPALTCESEDATPYWSDLGERWLTLEHTHYKRYPCCRWAHSAMDSAHRLMIDNTLSHTDIERVEIHTFHYATRLAGHEPGNLDELSYSIAFPVATMIVRGQMGAPELAPEILHDADILRISRATELIDDPELTERSVQKRWAQVTFVLKDGGRIQGEPCTPKGDVDDPLSEEAIDEKFLLLAQSVLGPSRCNTLQSYCRRFDSLDREDFLDLFDMCLTSTR
ncbi:MAG: MmgE/PrpD family protein [Pseudomonadota bacterium]